MKKGLTELVMILASVRRCGKSTIFEMLRQELLRRGAAEASIISRRCTSIWSLPTT